MCKALFFRGGDRGRGNSGLAVAFDPFYLPTVPSSARVVELADTYV